MKNKKNYLFFLLSIFLFFTVGGRVSEAKVILTTNSKEITDYNSGGSNYSGLTFINEYGQIIYDMDVIEEKYQTLVREAADSWNKVLGREIFVNYSDVGVQPDIGDSSVDKVDIDIKAGDKNSLDGGGYAFHGYGDHKGILTFSRDYLTEDYLEPGSYLYASAISAIRHEMGHALGLGHDYGVVMFSNSDPLSKEAHDACMADLEKGILPEIPEFNILAVKNILNHLNSIYTTPGLGMIPSNIIANTRLNREDNYIISATYFEEHFLTTAKAINLLTNQLESVSSINGSDILESKTQVIALDGTKYYLVCDTVNQKYYAVEEKDVILGNEIDIEGNYLMEGTAVDATATIDKNYNLYKLPESKFGPVDSVGTTNQSNLIDKSVKIKKVYRSTIGRNYYLFEDSGIEYIANSAAFFLTGDMSVPNIVEIESKGNFLTSKKIISEKLKIDKNYNVYTIDERLVNSEGTSEALCVSTTSYMGLINEPISIVAIYTSTSGREYYRAIIEGKEYVISAVAFSQK